MVHRRPRVGSYRPAAKLTEKRDGKVYAAQKEGPSPGHAEEIDRVMRLYPETLYYWLRGRVPQR